MSKWIAHYWLGIPWYPGLLRPPGTLWSSGIVYLLGWSYKWLWPVTEILDKMAIVTFQPQNTYNITHCLGSWPVQDLGHIFWIWQDSLSRQGVPWGMSLWGKAHTFYPSTSGQPTQSESVPCLTDPLAHWNLLRAVSHCQDILGRVTIAGQTMTAPSATGRWLLKSWGHMAW